MSVLCAQRAALARETPAASRITTTVLFVDLPEQLRRRSLPLQSSLPHSWENETNTRSWFAISVAIYRGSKCATLKTAGKTAGRTAETPEKHPKNSCLDCSLGVSEVFPAVFRLFDRDPLGTFFGCFSGCFQCRAFGTSVDGHRDCNSWSRGELFFAERRKGHRSVDMASMFLYLYRRGRGTRRGPLASYLDPLEPRLEPLEPRLEPR